MISYEPLWQTMKRHGATTYTLQAKAGISSSTIRRMQAKDKEFHRLLTACDGVKVISDHYVPSCYMNRNRYMVAQSQRVIAVYDGREKGGTLFTMRAAHVQKREIRVIEI